MTNPNEAIWINGNVMPMSEARIGVEDRGYQFADGVYEVVRIYNGRPFTLKEHLDRLHNSAEAIGIRLDMAAYGAASLKQEIEGFVAGTGLHDAMLYLQVTRGCAPRNHVFPERCRPTTLFYVRELPEPVEPDHVPPAKLITVADERWRKCWIKSIALLPNVLAKNEAAAQGADEAVFVENGQVSECSASNLFAVVGETLVTAPVGPKVLPGITRQILLHLASQMGIRTEERYLQEQELFRARELFITSTTRELGWVSHVNGKPVADGKLGYVTVALHRAYRERVDRETEQVLHDEKGHAAPILR